MIFDSKNQKSKRTVKYIWENFLLKTKNYLNNSEEVMEKLPQILRYELKLKSGNRIYPSRKAQEEIEKFTNIIYQIPAVKKKCSFRTVYKIFKNELQFELSLLLESSPLRNFDEVIDSLSSELKSSIKDYEFYFALEGIDLLEMKSINFGVVQIFKFDPQQKDKLLDDGKKKDDDLYVEFINNNFLEKVCIKCICSGDVDVSKRNAQLKARELINYLRFMICLLFYQRIPENSLKINMVSETYVDKNQILAQNITSGDLTLQWDSTRKPRENFPINKLRLEDIRKNLYFDLIFRVLNSDEVTELQGCVLTAIYWCGEAQNEFDLDIAFLKYWTALESIFSYGKDDLTARLARGISTLIAFSRYGFIETDEIDETYKSISDLYDKRSKIVHRGLRDSIKEVELIEICKYTSWTIISLMNMISHGYEKINQLDEEISRLYGDIKRTVSDPE